MKAKADPKRVEGPLLGEVLVSRGSVDRGALDKALEEQGGLRRRRLGEYLVQEGAITESDLEAALAARGDGPGSPIGQILRERGLSEADLERALSRQREDRGKRIGEILFEQGAASKRALFEGLAEKLELRFVALNEMEVDPAAVYLVSERTARGHNILPLSLTEDRLVVASADPANEKVYELLRFVTQRQIDFVVCDPEEIRVAVDRYYSIRGDDIDFQVEEDPDAQDSREADADLDPRGGDDQNPVVRLVNRMLADAIRRRASDIHVRPTQDAIRVLYRLDGVLTEVVSFSRKRLATVVGRIKILGSMNIAERRVPQDGRARVVIDGRDVDLRLSCIPTVSGESIVIRIIDQAERTHTLEGIGFQGADLGRVKDLLGRNHGLILVTGPTGSGKTSTLYAFLRAIATDEIKVVTVEDPVELRVDGFEQIQVNAPIGFSFAKALRHILRHDPDVIMLGEIRDAETAKVAVESALTGHLVLSTLHTNTAAGAVTRLTDMGIESFLVASSVAGVVAQRLLRSNCTHCRAPEDIDAAVARRFSLESSQRFFRGRGCERCNGTGFAGRRAVYELLIPDEELRRLMMRGASEDEVAALAVDRGMVPLTDNALRLAREGVTSLSEAYRIRLL